MFRAYQVKLDANGSGTITVSPYVESVEWDIYQISVQTQQQNDSCNVTINWNGYFLCGSNQGYRDNATGPPDIVVRASDILTIAWTLGNPGDQAQAGVWFNENPAGTTYSSSH